MNTEYHLEYMETEQTFTDMYKLYLINKSSFNYRMTMAVLVVLFFVVQYTINPQLIAESGAVLFWVRYAIFVALAFVLGYILNKYVVRKVDCSTAKKTGKEQFAARVQKCGKNLKVKIDCKETVFAVTFQKNTEEYKYEDVTRLYETEEMLGAVLGSIRDKKRMVGFPKSALEENSVEEFKHFLEGRCPQVKNGFKAI